MFDEPAASPAPVPSDAKSEWGDDVDDPFLLPVHATKATKKTSMKARALAKAAAKTWIVKKKWNKINVADWTSSEESEPTNTTAITQAPIKVQGASTSVTVKGGTTIKKEPVIIDISSEDDEEPPKPLYPWSSFPFHITLRVHVGVSPFIDTFDFD